MPRVRPEVEPNKVQSPEIVRALQQRLGLRQMHTTPTVSSELTPVIIVDDMSKVAQQNSMRYRAHTVVGAAITDASFMLYNPPDNDRMVRVLNITLQSTANDIWNFGIQDANVLPPGNSGQKPGQRMARGTQPPDAARWPNGSRVRLHGNDNVQVLTATFWEFRYGGGTADLNPMQISIGTWYLGPGSQLTIWQHNGTDVNLGVEWEESPIT